MKFTIPQIKPKIKAAPAPVAAKTKPDPKPPKPPSSPRSYNKNVIAIGAILVSIAFCFVAFTFYTMDQGTTQQGDRVTELELELNNLVQENSKFVLNKDEFKRGERGPMTLKELLKKSESIYGEVEKDRKEGFLWIDRKTSTCLVTLGALNGLVPGSEVNIFDGERLVGRATVDMPYDIISYVKPIDRELGSFANDYYRVVIGAQPKGE